MTMSRDYSPIIAHGVDEDTDDLEPLDPSVFLGADDDDLEEEPEDFDDEEEEELPEEEEEY